jgi:hypothetical protein
VILFNAHYPISLRSKEKELIRMFEIVLGRRKRTCLKQNGKEQVVLHIEVYVYVRRSYVMSKISYFIVRTFDVKHHAAHGTILINFGSEKRTYIF